VDPKVLEVREDWLPVAPVVLLLSLVLEVDPLDPPELNEITAKSTFPEVGLMITSWIVPIEVLPDEALISAFINLLARTSCPLPDRPVALNEPERSLQRFWEEESELVDGSVELEDKPLCLELEPEVPDEGSEEFCA